MASVRLINGLRWRAVPSKSVGAGYQQAAFSTTNGIVA